MSSGSTPASNAKVTERTFSPRMWLGCDFVGWLRIMARGRFRFHFSCVHIGVVTSCVSLGNSVLKLAQNCLHRGHIARTRIEHEPVFILGHWRTGTTLLHEFMMLDARHNCPNTYQCLDPNHFLLTENLFKRWFQFLLPQHRPMDKMQVGWDRPQEDEFAMCMLGQPSPYLDLVFPNDPPLFPGSLDLEGLSAWQRREWKRAFISFLKTLTSKDPRRLVLKSPPHSCRIPTLLELFPNARFVHIVRDPYAVFPSTVKLWKALAEKHGVQSPHHQNVEEKVLSQFTHLYERLEEGKKLIGPSRLHELKYEELVADPMGQMRLLYDRLEMGGFDELRPRLNEYLMQHSNYERNQFQLTPAQRELVTRRWGDVICRYGYAVQNGSSEGQAPASHANNVGRTTNSSVFHSEQPRTANSAADSVARVV